MNLQQLLFYRQHAPSKQHKRSNALIPFSEALMRRLMWNLLERETKHGYCILCPSFCKSLLLPV